MRKDRERDAIEARRQKKIEEDAANLRKLLHEERRSNPELRRVTEKDKNKDRRRTDAEKRSREAEVDARRAMAVSQKDEALSI